MDNISSHSTPKRLTTTLCCLLLLASSPNVTAGIPAIAQLADMFVYVKEPVRFTVEAVDTDHDPLTYSVTGLPGGAAIDASTGAFTWQPTLEDAGTHTAVFSVTDDANAVTMQTDFTVVMPALQPGEATRILRPNGGEAYRYGDTITIALATLACSDEAQVYVKYGNYYRNSWLYTPQVDDRLVLDGPTRDMRGVECRFFYSFPEQGINVGFYRLGLFDTRIGGHDISFGGDSLVRDSMKIRVNDPYGDQAPCMGPAEGMNLLSGDESDGFFTVVPRDLPLGSVDRAGRRPRGGMRAGQGRRAVSGGVAIYDLRGARVPIAGVRWHRTGSNIRLLHRDSRVGLFIDYQDVE